LLSVDEDDGDVLPVLLGEPGVVEDRELLDLGPRVGGNSPDDHAGVVAQVAAGLADQRDPSHGVQRRTARTTVAEDAPVMDAPSLQ
jgi:hypothetical protein